MEDDPSPAAVADLADQPDSLEPALAEPEAAAERSVFVDRARERRIRPSVLVEHLREVQRKPPRFRPEAFLESLFQAYGYLVRRHGADALDRGETEQLSHVYELLTLQPGA